MEGRISRDMVDKSTARALVYGALGVLALVLVVAIYALATKGSVQAELNEKLAQLIAREKAIEEEKRLRVDSMRKYDEASRQLSEKDEQVKHAKGQRDHLEGEYEKAKEHAKRSDEDANLFRRKVWDKVDQEEMEKLEKMSDEELKEELAKTGDEFFRDEADLENENVGEQDAEDLRQEKQVAKAFKDKFLSLKESLKSKDEHVDERGLEDLIEYGEQNEVHLDELDRDAKKNPYNKEKKTGWQETKRAAKLEGEAHKMDLMAQELRDRYEQKRLKDSEGLLDKIDRKAKGFKNDADASVVDDFAREIKGDEEQLEKYVALSQEDEAEEAANKLERDVERDRVILAQREQGIDDSTMTPEEKRRHHELLQDLDKELDKAEHDAKEEQRAIERNDIRHNAVKMAKAVNALAHQKGLEKMRHGQEIINHANDTLQKEGDLLRAMRRGDIENEEKLGEELGDEAADLEEDAETLFNEAEAGDFDDLSEKLLDEQLAKELRESASSMEHEANEVDETDRDRAAREAGFAINKAAQQFGSNTAKYGSNELKRHADVLEKEARELGRAVGAHAWQEEIDLAAKVFKDADAIEKEAKDMEGKVTGDKSLSETEREEDMNALREIEKQAKLEEAEARSISAEVRQKAVHKQAALKKQHESLSKVAEQAAP